MHKLWQDKTSFTEANPEASEMAPSYGWFFSLPEDPSESLCTQNGGLTTTCNSALGNPTPLAWGGGTCTWVHIHTHN